MQDSPFIPGVGGKGAGAAARLEVGGRCGVWVASIAPLRGALLQLRLETASTRTRSAAIAGDTQLHMYIHIL